MNLSHLPCDRRGFLRCTAAASAVSASGWLPALAHAAAAQRGKKSCVLVWLEGGLSQLESFDMKKKYSMFEPIESSVPGIQVCDKLPNVAKLMHHAAVIRSMSTPENEHVRARYHTHTGVRPVPGQVYPSLGSMVAMELGDPDSAIPNYVVIRGKGRGGTGSGSGFLGPKYQPLKIDDIKNGIENLTPPGGMQQFDRRLNLLEEVEAGFYKTLPAKSAFAHLTTLRRASTMMHSKESKAYDLDLEPAKAREAYAGRYGDSFLMARRLIEVGVPFVELSLPEWDNHSGCGLHKENLPPLDIGLSALIKDLEDRGLLDTTLVILMSEFGRGGPARVGTGHKEDRGHWHKAWTTVFFGGGIRGGQIIGKTDETAGIVEERMVNIADYFATICKILGVDYMKENIDPGGRPVPIVVDAQLSPPKVINEIL